MDQIKPLIRRIILREVAILQQRSLECAIAEALQIAGVAVDILLLIDGNDDTFIQHLLLDFCIQFAALCSGLGDVYKRQSSLRFAESASIAAASIRASISGSLYPKMLLALSV